MAATYSPFSHRVMPMIEGSLPDRVLESLVNIAHFGKIAVCGCSKQNTSCGELPKVINTDHHQKQACAGCIRLRSRPRPHAVVEHSKITTASASTPALGPFLLISAFGPSPAIAVRWPLAMVPVAVAASQRSYPP